MAETAVAVREQPKVIEAEFREVAKPKELVAKRQRVPLFRRRAQEETRDDGTYQGRPPLHANSVWFIFGTELLVLVACSVMFGLTFIIALQFALLGALGARRGGPATGMILGNVGIGALFATYLFGFILWPSSLVGALAVLLLAFAFLNTAAPGTGDVNPVAYIVAIVAVRAYLATFYAGITAVGATDSFLTWLTVFVVGIVPDWPTVANVLLFMLLNGTLVVYLVLLLKRIANPLSN